MLKNIDPSRAIVALGIIAALAFIAAKAPSQLVPFATAGGGLVLALFSVKKEGE